MVYEYAKTIKYSFGGKQKGSSAKFAGIDGHESGFCLFVLHITEVAYLTEQQCLL